ncbi:uncharacterized protein F4807DRAFT_472812 [Annulohypoxylon truncatum]|uniref:uncharacterized protein n=1 Tax=Annulohypoxylon truncatum TaxID=327061 RepID=UPI0020073DA6|nr:uncharacterized protein F4807DRAFT_472812 [Annulohypoxylon truncatum]KAI1211990.1 hypothetical protein F4807DRAFT_472812 [Annulohypoxylon truncatum]
MPSETPQGTLMDHERDAAEEEWTYLRLHVNDMRKKIKISHSFDVEYWTSVAKASELSVKFYEAEMNLAKRMWEEDEVAGDTESWRTTVEAHAIVDRIKASNYEKVCYEKQAELIRKGGPVQHDFEVLFNASQIGLDVDIADVGKRPRSAQLRFRQDLIQAYDAEVHSKKPLAHSMIFDSATGRHKQKELIKATHLVPHSLGEDILAALFGDDVRGELDTPYNGLLLNTAAEKAMDDGAIVIVPDLPDDPSVEEVTAWESTSPKDYKWRIMDPDADILNSVVQESTETLPEPILMRDLDGQKLAFKNDFRPRARYLYFLFVAAQLRLAWRHEYRRDTSKVLPNQLEKGFWATKGRYLKRSFLLALANEIGLDTDVVKNIPAVSGGDDNADDTGIVGIAKWLQFEGRREKDELETDYGSEDTEEE